MAKRGLEGLRRRLEREVLRREAERALRVRAFEREMARREQRRRRLERAADFVFQNVVQERVKLLSEYLRGPRLQLDRALRQAEVTPDARSPFPVTFVFRLTAVPDEERGEVALHVEREVAPDHLRLSQRKTVTMPLETIDLNHVVRWVEDQIVEALGAVCRIEQDPEYRRGTEVVDPVCGMRISYLDSAGTIEHEGRTYVFCAPSCLERFREAPERYLASRRRRDPAAAEPAAKSTAEAVPQPLRVEEDD